MTELTKQEKSFIETTRRKIGKTVYNHKLIQKNDKVVVGLSGGKDSFILLDALIARKKALQFKYELIAVHIDVLNVPYQADVEFMQSFCNEHHIKFYKIDIEVDFTKDKKLSPCFICSWHRRTELFKFVNRNNYNKLALGHHLDDAIETLLMNMSFNAEISSMPLKKTMFDGKFHIIRPMLEIEEHIFVKYANLLNLNREVKTCPFAKKSKREVVRKIISKLEEETKDARKNIYRSMNKILLDYLPEK